ncbi:MAG: TIGR04086 family membrane protein [Acutalibacteraceae bacterium]|nr:TIGR04086 family membrane protein [Clostridia bacterium]MEE1329957.1 TIGR04086 family membrane protein [Acutalibacteraceae bacterium]
MNNEFVKKGIGASYKNIIAASLIGLAVTAVFIAAFAAFMYFFASGFKYAALFATLSAAFGGFAAAFFLAGKSGSRGWLTGLFTGICTFLIITVVSLAVNHGALTGNTLFHLVIIVLASVIGGILGINKPSGQKYL